MLKMLLGRTGSGKTAQVTCEIREILKAKKKRVFMLVPEQQLFSVERALLPTLPSDEAEHLTLTSFTKLCDTLEEQYGGGAHTSLSKAASALLMWLNLRELSGLLKTYGKVPSGDTAMTHMMLNTAKELAANGMTPELLENTARDLPPDSPLADKLYDVALVISSYHQMVENLCGQDPADRLLRACESARKHHAFADAVIFLDSFTSFTSQEYQMISVMLSQAEAVTVTLGIDEPLTPLSHFDSLKETYRRLSGLAGSIGSERTVTRLPQPAATSELELLEQGLWDFSAEPHATPVGKQGQIRLITAHDPYEESEATALHILELADQGIPYDEIAIVVRDMNRWRGILDAALEQYHIPFFLSEKTDLNTKPAARMLYLALRCVSRRWQIADVMSLCKTGLCGVSPRDLDFFEEYTETWHLSGKRLTEDGWSMNPDGYTTDWSKRGKEILAAANRVRETVMSPLLVLDVKLKGASTLTDQCRALYEYLCDLSVKQQLSEQGMTHLSLGNVREAGETVRLWSFINEALSTIISVSSVMSDGGHPLTAEELSCVLSLMYAETDIGSVPARHDCVTVGTADTLRVDHIKASLLLGLCEGEFPRAVTDGGLFSEQEKCLLYEKGLEFISREEMMTSEELLYVYRAMAKPTERLYLSRSLVGTDGREQFPSAAFSRVTYLFPYIKVLPFSSGYLKAQTAAYVPQMNDHLPPPRAYALLGEEMWLSRSKLQRYAYCPYSYYGSYILKLRERTSAKVDNLISGLFLHHVLETFLRGAFDGSGHLLPMSDDEILQMADEIISAYVLSLNSDPHLREQGRFLHIFDRLRAIAIVLLKDMMSEFLQGSFTPVGFEWDTHGYTPDDPSPLVIPLRDREAEVSDGPVGIEKGKPVLLKMGGVIDRVDVYRTTDGKRAYIRVVDYKSSKHEFSEKTMTEDMDVQLLLYLFTLCSESNRHLFADENGQIPESVLPAQAMYLSPKEDTDTGEITPVRTGIILHDDDVLRAAAKELNLTYLPSGISMNKNGDLSGQALCTKERMDELEALLHETILEQAQAMYSGVATRTSSAAGCQYCRMREGCPMAAEAPKF